MNDYDDDYECYEWLWLTFVIHMNDYANDSLNDDEWFMSMSGTTTKNDTTIH